MKKVLATTMATLLFGLSFPVNTFALPNNIENSESMPAKDFVGEVFRNKIQDSDEKLLQKQEKEMPGILKSDKAPNGKPEGYVTVTYKLDPTKAKFKDENNGISEIKFYVHKDAGVPLNDVGINIKAVGLDPLRHKINENSPWIINPGNLNMNSPVTGDITLTANIVEKPISEYFQNLLTPKSITVWQDDQINWKDGVKLKENVDENLKKAFEEATFTSEGKDSKNPNLKEEHDKSGVEVKIKVTFRDDSHIEVSGEKLYVSSHVTAGIFNNVPNDAITTKFFLGEGTKVVDGKVTKEGDEKHPVPFKDYKVKPGTDLSEYILPTNISFIENINLKPLDNSYINPRWEPNNFKVSDENKEFTAKATKTYKISFKYKGYDADNRLKDINSLPKELIDKLQKEKRVERGLSYSPTRPESHVETIRDSSGQVKKVYNWIFSSWNNTKISNIQKDEIITGSWTRAQATSAKPIVEKITESDKVIKGQGEVEAKIKVTLGDTTLESTVGQDKNWKVEITKDLKKDDKVSVIQTEMGKKDSAKEEVNVSGKAKENKKPDTNPMPKPENNPDNKKQTNPRVTPDKKPLPSPEKKNKENQRGSNYFGLKFKNYSTKATKVKAQVENKSRNNKQKEEARHIIDVMSGNYQVIKDGVIQNRKMDVLPVIKNNRLMLPLRSLSEMIGAKVEWDPQTRTASFTNKGLVAKIQIDGNEIVLSNGKVIKMDSKPLNINGRILLPISNVANVFGLTNGNTKDGIDQNIEWDGDNKTVEINLNK
ncbi:copper amine oxidase N-terminal domain-containing protein [Peptoniphilus harei]|uniref:copper amine oxidase N-terminal domain-containing protein n=1 Tax=Peptoniphilus harei TaxID=54005 RepID=UPI0011DD5003|nr:copper amine oxidase N-terminal domain-containing protein [Peptoniphilus harei]